MAMTHVWKRKYLDRDNIDPNENQIFIQKKSFNIRFCELRANHNLDVLTKRIALKAAPSVVCLKIFSGDNEIRWGSGFILECNDAGQSRFKCTVITSTSLLRLDHALNALLDNLKVVVVLWDGTQYYGELRANDFHYNLAAITFEVDHGVEVASLRFVDDSLPITIPAFEEHSFQLHPHCDAFRLVPGEPLFALGRWHGSGNSIMIAPGVFSIEQCRFDCKDLIRSTCRITKCGIGGPVINRKAEVIGLSFFDLFFTPFLPSNIISKWWKHFQKFEDYCRPLFGLNLSNLYSIEVCDWEKIIQKFPNVKEGVVVDEVIPNSPASLAKVMPDDILVEFDGEAVKSCLQLFDRIWDKVGTSVNVVMIRRTDNSRTDASVRIANICDDKFNRWPLPGSG